MHLCQASTVCSFINENNKNNNGIIGNSMKFTENGEYNLTDNKIFLYKMFARHNYSMLFIFILIKYVKFEKKVVFGCFNISSI